MSLGEALPESLPKALAEALAESLPKTGGEPSPNGGVISGQWRLVDSEFRTYRKERHDAHDKNPYHKHDRPEAWRGPETGTTATGNWAGGCASAASMRPDAVGAAGHPHRRLQRRRAHRAVTAWSAKRAGFRCRTPPVFQEGIRPRSGKRGQSLGVAQGPAKGQSPFRLDARMCPLGHREGEAGGVRPPALR